MQTQNDQAMVNGKNPQVTKVNRYGWTVKDAPGKYIQIDKKDLYIDMAYQRRIRPNKIMQMAREWSWVACGALIITYRDDRYYVVDGQHRKMAADKRSDIKRLPCLLFDLDDIRDEADTFLTVNSMRTGLRRLEKVPARLTRGDTIIVELSEMLESTGHVFDNTKSSKRAVQFISALEDSYSADKELTKKVWPIFVDILNGQEAAGPIWQGLFYLFQRVDMTPHVMRLKKAGKQRMMQEIYKAKAFYATGGAKVYAEGLKNIINFGRRNRIQDLPMNPINNK